jgi:hypothetical protein
MTQASERQDGVATWIAGMNQHTCHYLQNIYVCWQCCRCPLVDPFGLAIHAFFFSSIVLPKCLVSSLIAVLDKADLDRCLSFATILSAYDFTSGSA